MNLRFLTGLAVGYVIGARAGRERYEQLAESWREFADSDLAQQIRGEISKVTSSGGTSSTETGMVTPPVIVGPAPDGKTGTAAQTDVVLPDLEASNAASITGDTPAASTSEGTSAKRLDPPASS